MKVLAICGSVRSRSTTFKFISQLAIQMPSVNFDRSLSIENVPMFHPDVVNNPSSEVNSIRSKIDKADLVLIVTPEYLHNIPAVLKNLFEWTASSGEFHQKKVLPVTLTPLKPRGDYAMQSLLFSLKALNANIMAKLQLYRADFEIDKSGNFSQNKDFDQLKEVINFCLE